jgi:hypothetical protein
VANTVEDNRELSQKHGTGFVARVNGHSIISVPTGGGCRGVRGHGKTQTRKVQNFKCVFYKEANILHVYFCITQIYSCLIYYYAR